MFAAVAVGHLPGPPRARRLSCDPVSGGPSLVKFPQRPPQTIEGEDEQGDGDRREETGAQLVHVLSDQPADSPREREGEQKRDGEHRRDDDYHPDGFQQNKSEQSLHVSSRASTRSALTPSAARRSTTAAASPSSRWSVMRNSAGSFSPRSLKLKVFSVLS